LAVVFRALAVGIVKPPLVRPLDLETISISASWHLAFLKSAAFELDLEKPEMENEEGLRQTALV